MSMEMMVLKKKITMEMTLKNQILLPKRKNRFWSLLRK